MSEVASRLQGRVAVVTFDNPPVNGLSHAVRVGLARAVERAIADPSVIIASDSGDFVDGRGHPRTAGTFSRVLGHYVRERQALDLMQALRKMTYLPAQRLGAFFPALAAKGRIQAGADADVTVFNPATIIDHATYEEPMQFSTGVVHVLGPHALVRGEAGAQHRVPADQGAHAAREGVPVQRAVDAEGQLDVVVGLGEVSGPGEEPQVLLLQGERGRGAGRGRRGRHQPGGYGPGPGSGYGS